MGSAQQRRDSPRVASGRYTRNAFLGDKVRIMFPCLARAASAPPYVFAPNAGFSVPTAFTDSAIGRQELELDAGTAPFRRPGITIRRAARHARLEDRPLPRARRSIARPFLEAAVHPDLGEPFVHGPFSHVPANETLPLLPTYSQARLGPTGWFARGHHELELLRPKRLNNLSCHHQPIFNQALALFSGR